MSAEPVSQSSWANVDKAVGALTDEDDAADEAYISGGTELASLVTAGGASRGGAAEGVTEANEAGGGGGIGAETLEAEAREAAVRLDPDGRDV